MGVKKTASTLYLSPEVKERLEVYCALSKQKNKTKIYNEAITEYLNSRLKDEYKKEGLIQWKAIENERRKKLRQNLMRH